MNLIFNFNSSKQRLIIIRAIIFKGYYNESLEAELDFEFTFCKLTECKLSARERGVTKNNIPYIFHLFCIPDPKDIVNSGWG